MFRSSPDDVSCRCGGSGNGPRQDSSRVVRDESKGGRSKTKIIQTAWATAANVSKVGAEVQVPLSVLFTCSMVLYAIRRIGRLSLYILGYDIEVQQGREACWLPFV